MAKSATSRKQHLAVLAACLAVSLAGGCKVMSLEEDQALRARANKSIDAPTYVSEIWDARALPEMKSKAVPLDELTSAVARDLDQAGSRFGRRVGEGSAWTFVVKGRGTVTQVNAASPRGIVRLALPGSGASAREAELQIGPVVTGTAVRDALPFVSFNDFSDQLAFADLGRALTQRALLGVRPEVQRLADGQQIAFIGVINLREPGDPLVITPVSMGPAS